MTFTRRNSHPPVKLIADAISCILHFCIDLRWTQSSLTRTGNFAQHFFSVAVYLGGGYCNLAFDLSRYAGCRIFRPHRYQNALWLCYAQKCN